MSIGKWIVIVFILFAAFIGTLVTICIREDISLVSKDYYTQELAYQERIIQLNNMLALEHKPVVTATPYLLRIAFDSTYHIEQGKVELFCPSDSKMDRNFSLTVDINHEFTSQLTGLRSGMYRVKLLWSMEGKDYYQEEIVNL